MAFLFFSCSFPRMMMAGYFTQQPLAPRQHILPGCLEIAVYHGSATSRGGRCSPSGGAACRAKSPPQMRCIFRRFALSMPIRRSYLFVVLIGELPSRVAVAGDPMLRQLAPRRRIDRIADLLPAGGRRLDMELRRQPPFFTKSFITNSAMGCGRYFHDTQRVSSSSLSLSRVTSFSPV